jgi:hypothetical protein
VTEMIEPPNTRVQRPRAAALPQPGSRRSGMVRGFGRAPLSSRSLGVRMDVDVEECDQVTMRLPVKRVRSR